MRFLTEDTIKKFFFNQGSGAVPMHRRDILE